jgi:hypothetical protein
MARKLLGKVTRSYEVAMRRPQCREEVAGLLQVRFAPVKAQGLGGQPDALVGLVLTRQTNRQVELSLRLISGPLEQGSRLPYVWLCLLRLAEPQQRVPAYSAKSPGMKPTSHRAPYLVCSSSPVGLAVRRS